MESRTDPDVGLDDLLHSLSSVGQLSPIRLRPHPEKTGSYQTIYGNRRIKAAKKLGWKTIMADVVEADDPDAMVLALLENLDRKDFSDYEKAILFERLHLVANKSYTEVARLVGRSPATISQHVAMLHLFSKSVGSDEEKTKVLSRLPERHARILAHITDPAERWNTAKLAVSANLGLRELERLCRKPKYEIRTVTSLNSIRNLIKTVMDGFNQRDIRPFLNSIAKDQFTLFAGFPPFDIMDYRTAIEHVQTIIRSLDGFKAVIEDLDIRIARKFAYATMRVPHDFTALGKTMHVVQRATLLLRLGKRWEILHWHWSTINPPEFLSIFTNYESNIFVKEAQRPRRVPNGPCTRKEY